MSTLMDSWDEQNDSNYVSAGQSFTGDGNNITSIIVVHRKTDSPVGNLYAKIYTHSGTFGTSSLPTGTALATSDAQDASLFPTDYTATTYTFSAPFYKTTNGTYYVMTIEGLEEITGGYVYLARTATTGTHAGNSCYWNGLIWVADAAGFDLRFQVWGDVPAVSTGDMFLMF